MPQTMGLVGPNRNSPLVLLHQGSVVDPPWLLAPRCTHSTAKSLSRFGAAGCGLGEDFVAALGDGFGDGFGVPAFVSD